MNGFMMGSASVNAQIFRSNATDVLAPRTKLLLDASEEQALVLNQTIQALAESLNAKQRLNSLFAPVVFNASHFNAVLSSCETILKNLKIHIVHNTTLVKEFSIIGTSQQNINRVVANLPDFIPIKEVVDVFNLIRNISAAIKVNAQSENINFETIQHEFFEMLTSDLSNLVGERGQLQAKLRGGKKTNIENSILSKKMKIIDEMILSFGILNSCLEFRSSIFNVFKNNEHEQLKFSVSDGEHSVPVNIELLPPPHCSYDVLMKNVSAYLNDCISRWQGLNGNVSITQSHAIFDADSTFRNIELFRAKFKYFHGSFLFIKNQQSLVFHGGDSSRCIVDQLEKLISTTGDLVNAMGRFAEHIAKRKVQSDSGRTLSNQNPSKGARKKSGKLGHSKKFLMLLITKQHIQSQQPLSV